MRKLALVLAVALASGRASALGLGEIELRSALNEPFNAEIRLLAAQPAELEGAVVRLAPQESFQQAGIERPAALSDLIFNVVRRADGTAVIQVTSSQPVREPYLDFIVQLRWPTGRLLREYTVLLDPPLFSGDKLAPVSAPVAAAPAAAPTPRVAPVEPAPAPTEQTPAKPAVSAAPAVAPRPPRAAPAPQTAADGARSYGPTQRTDTAWTIAEQVRPDNGVTVFQAMLALLAANPDAFYNGNVNNLLAGYVLRVPEREFMTALPAQQAEREVARQYEAWRQAKRGGVPMAPAGQPVAEAAKPAGEQAAAKPAGEEAPRLKLVAPAQTATPGAGGGARQGMDQVRSELAMALESADAARRENEELRSRLSALEGQINSMQRLLTLKDDTLGNLQPGPGEAETPAAIPGGEVPPAEGLPAETAPEAAQPSPRAETPVQPEPEPSLDIFANPSIVAAAGGAVLLLLAVAWLVARRRRAGADDDGEARLEPVMAQAAPAAPVEKSPAASSPEAMADLEEPLSARMSGMAEEVAKGAAKDVSGTADGLDVLHTAEGDIDPMVEADVYLAYRRYQQAEALIQGALAKQPHRYELKGKLLEIYYAARNVDAFQSLAESLYDELGQNADDPLWYRIVPMGAELLPNHPLFNPAYAAPKTSPAAVGAGSALFAGDLPGGGSGLSHGDHESGAHKDDDLFGDAAPVYGTRVSDETSLDLDLNADAAGGAAPAGTADKMDFDLNMADEVRPDTLAGGHNEKDMVPDITAAPAQADDLPGGNAKDRWGLEPALSEFGSMDFNLDDSDFLAGTDVVGTKLDLARAYIDMGDQESAREILNEVLAEGNDQQKEEARGLSQQLA